MEYLVRLLEEQVALSRELYRLIQENNRLIDLIYVRQYGSYPPRTIQNYPGRRLG